MSCRPFREDLTGYLDQELPAGRQEEIETHLASCDACRKEAESLRKSFEILSLLTIPSIRPGFLKRFHDRAGARATPTRPVLPWAIPLTLAASLLVAIGLAWMARGGDPAPREEPTLGNQVEKRSDGEPREFASNLTDEERAIVENLDLLGSEHFDAARQFELLDSLPAVVEVDDATMEAVARGSQNR